MNLSLVQPTDVWQLIPGAQIFFQESALPGQLNPDHFDRTISRMIRSGTGLFVRADTDDGRFAGAIGGSVVPDWATGELTAIEMFWFTMPEHRTVGIRLFDRFEQEARARGAKRIHMIHLLNFCGDRVDRFYQKRGYRPIEKAFTKEL